MEKIRENGKAQKLIQKNLKRDRTGLNYPEPKVLVLAKDITPAP